MVEPVAEAAADDANAAHMVVEIHAVADIVKQMPATPVVTTNGNEDLTGIEALVFVVERDLTQQDGEAPPTIVAQGSGTIVVKATRRQQEAVAQVLDDLRGKMKAAGR